MTMFRVRNKAHEGVSKMAVLTGTDAELPRNSMPAAVDCGEQS
jgi:hypothetical protein